MRRTLIAVVAGVVLAAFALPALAATPTTTTATTTATAPAKAHKHWFAGSVSAVGSSSLSIGVLWTGPRDGSLNGTTVNVGVDSNTRIIGPGKTSIQLSDIQSNDLVAVSALGTGASDLTAAKIRVYCNCHWIGGTIASLGAGSLTVQVKKTGPYDTVLNGGPVTIQTSSSTVYIAGKNKTPIQFSDLKVGDGVGVVFSANGFFKAPGFDPSTATFTAKRVHLWGHGQAPPPSSDASVAAQVTT